MMHQSSPTPDNPSSRHTFGRPVSENQLVTDGSSVLVFSVEKRADSPFAVYSLLVQQHLDRGPRETDHAFVAKHWIEVFAEIGLSLWI